MATARVRHDGRQGTIDQDQEFIDFLQSLTEPIAKPTTNGTEEMSQEKGYYHASRPVSEGEEGEQGKGGCREEICQATRSQRRQRQENIDRGC